MEQIRESELILMQLHEEKIIHAELMIQRVIGGWIYNRYVNDFTTFTSVFIPEER